MIWKSEIKYILSFSHCLWSMFYHKISNLNTDQYFCVMSQLEINLINKKTCTVLKSIVKLFVKGYPFEVGFSYEVCLSIVDTLGYFLMISMSDNRKCWTLSMFA